MTPTAPASALQSDPQFIRADSAASDSVAPADSLANANIAEMKGVVLANPAPLHSSATRISPAQANSWVLLGLLAMFIAVCFKIKNNGRYFSFIFRDLTDARERGNVFDDTVRETSFLIMLNVACAMTCGVLIYVNLLPRIPALAASPLLATLLCVAATTIYGALMPLLYMLVGDIFTDRSRAKLWTQGFLASQAVLGVALFPLALISLFYPGARGPVTAVAIALLILAKTLFISKGFRIFFINYSSWVTFLYYLCSLEIVPLILTFALAHWAGTYVV